jgi:hypothetical protein
VQDSPSGTVTTMLETLNTARIRVMKGTVTTDNETFCCDVHHISSRGATLRLRNAGNVPSTFALYLSDLTSVVCHVIRRSRIDVVVRFERES